MKILYLTPRFPYPPNRGDALHVWHQLRYLAQRHEVWFACVDQHRPSAANLAHVRGMCREARVYARPRVISLARGAVSLCAGASVTQGFFWNAACARDLRQWSGRVAFDAVLTFSSAMSDYAALVDARRRVIDLSDVDSQKWAEFAAYATPLRGLYALESKRVAALESRALALHDSCLVINRREQRKLNERFGGVSSDVFCAAVDPSPDDPPQAVAPREPIIALIGSMDYAPNVRAVERFARDVWPIIARERRDARWLIVGRNPTRSVRRLGRLKRVTVTGTVPRVQPYLSRTRVIVNPVAGTIGLQTKLLVALAAGKAAVVSRDSAEGIDYDGRAPFLIADTPADYAAATLRLLDDDELARELSHRAQAMVTQYYDPARHLNRLDQYLAATPEPDLPGNSSESEAAPNPACVAAS